MPQPGEVAFGVPFEDYLAWDCLSQSTLKAGRTSMLALRHAIDNKLEPTDAMQLGTAVHSAGLEPHLLPGRVVFWEGRRAGKEWSEFAAANAGKVILTGKNIEHFQGMVEAINRHPVMLESRREAQGVEASVVGDYCGELFRARADILTADTIYDIKTCANIEPRRFEAAAHDLGYHIQAAIYTRLFGRSRFVFICVEKSAPYDVVAYEAGPDFIDAGHEEAAEIIEKYRECKRTGEWPGRASDIQSLALPGWATAENNMPVTDGAVEALL